MVAAVVVGATVVVVGPVITGGSEPPREAREAGIAPEDGRVGLYDRGGSHSPGEPPHVPPGLRKALGKRGPDGLPVSRRRGNRPPKPSLHRCAEVAEAKGPEEALEPPSVAVDDPAMHGALLLEDALSILATRAEASV